MNYPRFYLPHKYTKHEKIFVPEEIGHKISSVLRNKPGDKLVVFNGNNVSALAEIIEIKKKKINIQILEIKSHSIESPINIELGQAIAKSTKMDFIIQKAVELGVNSITPLLTERTIVKMKVEKEDNKISHWQKVVISACEQCGRNFVPKINAPEKLESWLKKTEANIQNLILDPYSQQTIKDIKESKSFRLLIGPEGGLSEQEVQIAKDYNFLGLKFGPRILRAETAALAAITGLQLIRGDLG